MILFGVFYFFSSQEKEDPKARPKHKGKDKMNHQEKRKKRSKRETELKSSNNA